MHTEKNNRNLVYLMLSTVMALTSQERDLGVTVATPLKSMALWETAEKKKKVNKKLRIIQKGIENMADGIILLLCETSVHVSIP